MNIGDTFRFLDETGGGLILEKDGDRVLVLPDDQFERWVNISEILPVPKSVPLEVGSRSGIKEISGKWSVGMDVCFVDETGKGKILRTEGADVVVLHEDGFEYTYGKDRLLPLTDHDAMKSVNIYPVGSKERKVAKSVSKPGTDQVREVDLHLSELLDSDMHLKDHQKLLYQLEVAQNELKNARAAGCKKVILIHGVGKGRLKMELHRILDGMERLQYADASMQRYGIGATEVTLF